MVLPFKPRFVAPILEGIKLHTIRTDAGHRWKPGMAIHMATGVRSKNYNEFKRAFCVSVQAVKMDFTPEWGFDIYIDGRILSLSEIEVLVYSDGFTDRQPIALIEFIGFFKAKAKKGIYTGRLIHWTALTY